MIPYRYVYFIGTLYPLAFWFFFFWKWPRRRRPMIIIGTLCIALGLFAEYFWWLNDWWHPQTITGTKIGLEDVILSFTLPGVSILLYKFFFKKDLDEKFELTEKTFLAAIWRFAPVFIASFGTTSLLFFVFHIRSTIATSAGMLIAIIFVLMHRRDLFPAMFWTAILAMVLSIPAYLVFILLSPGSVDSFWNFSQITGYRVIGIPIEDIAWIALGGLMMGGIVEYGFGYRLVDEKK
jgi:hypothetical protein